MVLTRFLPLEITGVFTIAYANSSLFLLVGRYGVRNYQVSDIKNEYSFLTYKKARVITVISMLIAALLFIVATAYKNNYTLSKSIVMVLAVIYKMPDAIEDLYYGEYQRLGRLDVASKCMSIRLVVTIFCFIVTAVITQNIVIAFVASDLVSFLMMLYLLTLSKNILVLKESDCGIKNDAIKVLRECFPLFIGTFLLQYINNAPKYAIDSMMSDDVQACFGFISMPVFVTGLLSKIIYDTLIKKMSIFWNEGNRKLFLKYVYLQTFITIIITLVTVIAGELIGIPVLSGLYNTDLSNYKKEFIILLIAGGILAEATFLNVVLTIMRQQKTTLFAYVISSVVAFCGSNAMILAFGIWGAASLYLLLTGVLLIYFMIMFCVKYKVDMR